ncbi:hypothetical protein BD779DRAFT_1117814 [Infundibulicybe gibba]|nr:hypothetical protein BD779DRAFT_1117814 [Infundibulicybe gibba]
MAGLPSDSSSTGSDFPSITELTISSPDDDVRGKPSARTVALTTEDILREIFWRFDIASNSDHAAANRTALLHAALACKAFMEPALDVLWWSMSSMIPALKLLPNLEIVPNTSNTFTFSNGFSDDGWARFDYHSKRVREFHYHSAPAQEMATAALFHFSQYRPTIFRLRKIVWTTRLSPSIMLLTPPTLNSLDIAGIEGDNPSIMTTLLLVLGHSLSQ